MKTKRFLSFAAIFAIVFAFFACQNEVLTEPQGEEQQGGEQQGGESSGGSQVNNSSSSSLTNKSSSSLPSSSGTKNNLPKVLQPVIGYGYDISGEYAASSQIKYPVLNQDALLAANQIKEDPNMVSGEFNTTTGADINNYRNELTKKVSVNVNGGYGLASFEAEVGTNFGQTRIQNSSFVFATTSIRIAKVGYNISNRDGLDAFFTDEFKKDLNGTMTAKAIVDKYGTHVMLGGVIGARLDHHLSTVAKSETAINNLGLYVRASAEAKAVFASGGAGTEYEQNSTIQNSFDTKQTEVKTRVFGGIPQYAQSIHDRNSYDAWISSIEGNEIWSDYYPNSLFGIWALPMSATRSADLLAEVERRCVLTTIKPPELPETTELVTVRPSEKRITDAGWYSNVYDVVNFDDFFNVNLDSYKAQGYTKITFYIQMNVREYDDGYQYIGLWSSSVANDTYKLAEQQFEHGPGSYEPNWFVHEFKFPNININKFENKGSGYQFVIRYNADGWLSDDWGNKELKVKLTFSK